MDNHWIMKRIGDITPTMSFRLRRVTGVGGIVDENTRIRYDIFIIPLRACKESSTPKEEGICSCCKKENISRQKFILIIIYYLDY